MAKGGKGDERPAAAETTRRGRPPRGAGLQPAPDDAGGSVTAVSRALAVLDCFETAEGPLGNLEIARETGLPKSTVSRITRTLTAARYLHFRPDLGKYGLGPRILTLARAMRRASPLPALIQPALQSLADATRGTVGLGEIQGLDAVYLQVARGVSMIMLRVDPGSHMPLLDSALGLALLCGTPEPQRSRIVEALREKADVARSRVDAATEELVRLGYCTSAGTWREEINGVGAPFRLAGDDTVYAINIGGPTFLMDFDKLHAVDGPRLRETLAGLAAQGLVEPIFPGPA